MKILTTRAKYFVFDSFLDEWCDKLGKHSDVSFVAGIVNELKFFKVRLYGVEVTLIGLNMNYLLRLQTFVKWKYADVF